MPADDDYYFAFGNVNRRQSMQVGIDCLPVCWKCLEFLLVLSRAKQLTEMVKIFMQASLRLDVHSLLYNTTEADSLCVVYGTTCSVSLPLLGSKYAVVATPPKVATLTFMGCLWRSIVCRDACALFWVITIAVCMFVLTRALRGFHRLELRSGKYR